MRKLFLIFACAAMLCGATTFADDAPAVSASHEVAGLKLPASFAIDSDESFTTVTADTKGTVKWLVLSNNGKIKYRINPATPNEVIVGLSRTDGVITVFAIAVVDGKLTDYARTDITVKGTTSPSPLPVGPVDPPPVVTGPFFLNIIEDPTKRTPGTKDIVDSPALRTKLTGKQIKMRVFSADNAEDLKRFKFDAVVTKYGVPLMILQDKTGRGLVIEKLSEDQAALLKRLGPIVGGF